MKKVFKSIVLMLVILALSVFSLASCFEDPHVCESECPECGGCTDANCTEDVCAEKCECEVKPVIYSLVIKASKTDVTRGDTVTFTASLKSAEGEEPITDEVEFSIISGAESASLSGNVLTISNNAKHGDVIKVKAHEGATDSNIVEIVVNVPASGIEIFADGATNLDANHRIVTLSHVITPEGASNEVSYVITEGADSATLSGNVLIVNANTITGTIIRVKATSGSVESNELVFTFGYPLESLTAALIGSSNIKNGESAQLSVSLNPTNATNGQYTWEFLEGGDYVTIIGNIITVKADAPTGAKVRLQAVAGDISSNVVEFTVGYPLESLTATLVGSSNIKNGEFAQLSVSLNPTNATNGQYTWEFLEGGDYVTIIGNIITVKADAPTGAKVRLQAVAGNISSNVVEFTVGYPLESITVTTNATNIVSGGMAHLSVVIDPENATNGKYVWEFLEGGEYATVVNNVITVNQNAPTGAKVRLQAVAGNISSNVVEFTVGYPLTSLTATLVGSSSNIRNGGSAELSVSLNPENATNGQYVWEFIEGSDFAEIKGNVIKINEDAPLGSIIRIVAVAGDIRSNEIVITAGIPIETITISSTAPEILDRGASYPLSLSVTPDGATTNAITWVVEEGGDYVSVVSGFLTVDKNTPAGTRVKVYATSGSIKSNSLEFTVGIALESIEISLVGSANVNPDASRSINYVLNPSNASDNTVTWVIDDGIEYATIVNGTISVNADAPIGAKVTFHAEIGEVKSNSLTITVGIPTESIEISIVGSLNVDPGKSASINHTLAPSNASIVPLTWVIDDGVEYATIVNGTIFVNENAPVGAKVTFHAEIGEIKSNTLTITVGTPIESIEIEATGSHEVVKGNSVGLMATVSPSKASATLVSWVITEGGEFATIKGTTLIINSDATTGATVKVKAVWGDVESNELSFTVMATQEEINASKYFLDLNTSNIRIDKKGASSPVLTAEILNGNYEKVENMDVEFTVISGEEYLRLAPNGYNCSFVALGHGEAIVEVKIVGTNVTETVAVDVIVPPESIALPEVFAERPGFEYYFSNIDPRTGDTESLPFLPTVKGDALACTDLLYTFTHESGATGNAVATYEDGMLTFHKTGKVTVTITSASGSRVEAATSYTFNINQGYNANTFEEFSYIVESNFYTGSVPINLVVLEKPDGSATGYTYGYDMVPSMVLLPQSEQTIAMMLRRYTTYEGQNVNIRIQAVNKGLWVNGNNHKLDVSQLKVFTLEEYDAYATEYGVTGDSYFPHLSSFLSAETWYNEGPTDPDFVKASYYVRLYNFEVMGNAPITYDPTKYSSDPSKFVGAMDKGLSVGNFQYDTHYYIDANNLTASGFRNGLAFTNIVGNGKISNLYAYNCYSTGIVARSSIVTLENLKLGPCGATGMELAPEDSGAAGLNNDEKGKITISGTVEASTNLNDGNTNYFKYYTIQGATVPMIITGNTQMYAPSQVAHIRNSNGQFIFVSLLFNDMSTLQPNQSIVDYPAYQEGGIINIADLPTDGSVDTTHQFVKMDIYVTLPGLGTVQAGTAYFYNHNYGK